MTIVKMCIRKKRNLVTIIVAVLAMLVLFFDVAAVSAFNGNVRPGNGTHSGPPPSRRGEGYYRADPTQRNDRSDSRPGYYRDDRGPRFYSGQPFSPYGGPWRGRYGERRAVQSRGDAQRTLNDYYMGRNMRIGPIREKQFFFEADILDRNNRFMDRVIIDKRSGRIRSIY